MQKIISIFFLIFWSISQIFAQNSFPKQEKYLDSLLGKPAPIFEVLTLQGDKYPLEYLQGQVVVINFWYAACGPCLKEIPLLNELVDKYQDTKVHFLAFSNRDNKEFLLQWLKRRTFKYVLIPSAEKIAKLYGIHIFPVNIIVDTEGIVRFVKTGYDFNIKNILDKEIQKLLSK